MRMRIIIETDYKGKHRDFREEIRGYFLDRQLMRGIPGEIVYIATEIAETAVITHDGKVTTIG